MSRRAKNKDYYRAKTNQILNNIEKFLNGETKMKTAKTKKSSKKVSKKKSVRSSKKKMTPKGSKKLSTSADCIRGVSYKMRVEVIQLKQTIELIEMTAQELVDQLGKTIKKNQYWGKEDLDAIASAKNFILKGER